MMRKTKKSSCPWRLLLAWAASAGWMSAAAGCQQGLQPNLRPPGTIWQQRNQAVYHDPYPIDHFGPPIVGGRPREHSRPLAEAADNQLVPKTSRW
jgi:hypothetical protein